MISIYDYQFVNSSSTAMCIIFNSFITCHSSLHKTANMPFFTTNLNFYEKVHSYFSLIYDYKLYFL